MSQDSGTRNYLNYPHRYYSYLLRLWVARSDYETWRASLERVGSGERRSFTSLRELFKFLDEVTQNPPEAGEESADGEAEEMRD